MDLKKKKVFCENCRDYVDFDVVEEPFEFHRKNIVSSFMRLDAKCKKCGSLIYHPELNDVNVDRKIDAYEEEKKRFDEMSFEDKVTESLLLMMKRRPPEE